MSLKLIFSAHLCIGFMHKETDRSVCHCLFFPTKHSIHIHYKTQKNVRNNQHFITKRLFFHFYTYFTY